ncbi:MAG: DUF1292 domain-containing protein [Firmicutes bacterium]|nr:DUF1292 domain-containing protein [Bacillota bacterium]
MAKMISVNGQEYKLVHSFEHEAFKKVYVLFTDGSTNEYGYLRVFANWYTPGEEPPVLKALETEEEWEMINDMMENLIVVDE